MCSADRGERGLNQVADVGIAFLIARTQRGCGAIGLFGQVTASQLGIQVAADELKQWIGRILFRKGPGDLKRLFVLLIVIVKAKRQVEAGFGRSKNSCVDGAFQLLNAFLFVAAGNAHEEPENASDAGERVHVIVVKTQAHVCVAQIRVQSDSVQEAFPRAHSGAGPIAVVSAQAVNARKLRVSHAGVEFHLGGIVQRDLRLGER